ncbi:CBS domain-containing protein [Sphingobium sp. ZW T5_29]|uniref:CBS domain-containing protein n=1 Tax=Sphingobium sp. ZW T5_29 TaxID=3378077 RepID=UPI00385555C1
MTISAILQGKGREVIQVGSQESVLSAVRLLSEKRIGCVPVVDDGKVLGIFSERDLLHHVARDGAAALDRRVGDIMTAPAITTDEKTPVIHCLSLMTKRRVRHLPVVVDGQLIGLVSIGDLVKFRIDSIEADADALRNYIQSA